MSDHFNKEHPGSRSVWWNLKLCWHDSDCVCRIQIHITSCRMTCWLRRTMVVIYLQSPVDDICSLYYYTCNFSRTGARCQGWSYVRIFLEMRKDRLFVTTEITAPSSLSSLAFTITWSQRGQDGSLSCGDAEILVYIPSLSTFSESVRCRIL